MLRITDVVKHLLIINVIVFFTVRYALWDLLGPYFHLFHPSSEGFSPVQIVTHMFMHGDESHLLFNMLGLYFLGPMVESRLGSKRFLILYLLSGLGASLTHFIFFPQSILVGASGAVFGVAAAFGLLFPNIRLMLLFPPIPVRGKYLALVLIAIGVLFDPGGNVAHLAHVGGAIVGAAVIYYWRKFSSLI